MAGWAIWLKTKAKKGGHEESCTGAELSTDSKRTEAERFNMLNKYINNI